MRTRTHARRLLAPAALLAGLGLAGCEHPIAVVTPHLEAADAVLETMEGEELARTVDNRSWTGSGPDLMVGEGAELDVLFIDFQGAEIDPNDREDLQVRLEFEDPSAGVWEPLDAGGRLFAFAPGRQSIRVLVWHLDHVDFVTPWLEVEVAPPATPARSPASALPSPFQLHPPRP